MTENHLKLFIILKRRGNGSRMVFNRNRRVQKVTAFDLHALNFPKASMNKIHWTISIDKTTTAWINRRFWQVFFPFEFKCTEDLKWQQITEILIINLFGWISLLLSHESCFFFCYEANEIVHFNFGAYVLLTVSITSLYL